MKVCFYWLWVFIELHYVGFANELIKYELMHSLQRYAVFSAKGFSGHTNLQGRLVHHTGVTPKLVTALEFMDRMNELYHVFGILCAT